MTRGTGRSQIRYRNILAADNKRSNTKAGCEAAMNQMEEKKEEIVMNKVNQRTSLKLDKISTYESDGRKKGENSDE